MSLSISTQIIIKISLIIITPFKISNAYFSSSLYNINIEKLIKFNTDVLLELSNERKNIYLYYWRNYKNTCYLYSDL